MKRERRVVMLAVILSITLHLSIAVPILAAGLQSFLSFDPCVPVAKRAFNVNLIESDWVTLPEKLSPESVWTAIDESLKKFAGMSPEQQDRLLAKVLKDSGRVREKSVGEITTFLGVKQSDFNPAAGRKDGRFDVRDSTLLSIKRKPNQQGRDRYDIVMVDRDGDTMTVSGGQEFDVLYNVVQMGKDNPIVKGIIEKIVFKVLGDMIRDDK